ncbi:MAG: AmmeMemoRadiSam system protein A [Candidatus Nanoarchaeia archaeon]|nr:AmmeMemoRadiSam system protein A [Candidatus Nanoarchaeia archaeon]MDD5587672.1 AmmeMemoRadiSam system protein A [Candidatus Nanoarchaeia archaeon]
MNKLQAKKLLELARKSIETYFSGKEIDEKELNKFKEKKGVFVTLYSKRKLKGCIGFIEPYNILGKSIAEAARFAAFSDNRFESLKQGEKFSIEISILTIPKLIKVKTPEEYLKKIKLGKDGLIIEYLGRKGLLLPQVPIEHKMNLTEFLDSLCYKAGLSENFWKDKFVKIYKFQAEIIKEHKE